MSFFECSKCGGIPGVTYCCTSTKKEQPTSGTRVSVDSGALQMVINALRRDATEGKLVRGEMADELERTIIRL